MRIVVRFRISFDLGLQVLRVQGSEFTIRPSGFQAQGVAFERQHKNPEKHRKKTDIKLNWSFQKMRGLNMDPPNNRASESVETATGTYAQCFRAKIPGRATRPHSSKLGAKQGSIRARPASCGSKKLGPYGERCWVVLQQSASLGCTLNPELQTLNNKPYI